MAIGCTVLIHGLMSENAKQYNGETGVITSGTDSKTGRYGVHLQDLDRPLAIKPSNLTQVEQISDEDDAHKIAEDTDQHYQPVETFLDSKCMAGSPQIENEVCVICLDVYDKPVKLPCGHSYCEKCLDGWVDKYDIKQFGKKCPTCRGNIPPSKELIQQLTGCASIIHQLTTNGSSETPGKSKQIMDAQETMIKIMSSLADQGYDKDEIERLVASEHKAMNEIPSKVLLAIGRDGVQVILDFLGPLPVDKRKLEARGLRFDHKTLLHIAVARIDSNLSILLLQFGADIASADAYGTTPMDIAVDWLVQLEHEDDSMFKLLREWGASFRSNISDLDEVDDLFFRRCEIVNLNNREEINGQTCVVEKYFKKEKRFKIITEHTNKTFLVGLNNLKRRNQTPDDPGYCVTFDEGEFKRHAFNSNEECQAFVRSFPTV